MSSKKQKTKKAAGRTQFEDWKPRDNCRRCSLNYDDILSKPVTLRCGHKICDPCVSSAVKCPICKTLVRLPSEQDSFSNGSGQDEEDADADNARRLLLMQLDSIEEPEPDPAEFGFESLPIPLIKHRRQPPTKISNHITLEGINKDVKTMVRKLIQEKQAEKKKKEEKENEEVFEEDDGTPGQVGWTINNVSIQRALAKPCMSKVFSTGKRGYNFQLEVFLNGTGPGEDWYVSLYFYMCKGSYDWLLQWPCPYVFRVELVKTAHLFELSPTHFFVTAATSEALKKPSEDRGVPEKRDLLIKQTEAFSDKYCNHNAMLIRVTYSNDPNRLQMPASHGNNESVM